MWLVCHRSLSETVEQCPHYAQGLWHADITGVGNHPPTYLCMGTITSEVQRVQVLAEAELRRTDHVQWGRPDSEEVIKQA